MGLFIGKKFKITSNGKTSNAIIIDIQDKFVIVLIEGIKFKMDKKRLIDKFSDNEIEKNSKNINKCENCMEYKKGNCFGESQICEDFRLAPIISKEELDRWPKNGSVSRSKSDKYIIREHDDIYNKYY